MKRLFAIAFFLVSLLSTASANIISYRYIIPGTNDTFSIEFPNFFIVESSEMDSFYPAVYMFGYNKDKTIQRLKEEGNDIVAYDKSSLDAMVFIHRIPYNWGFSFQDLSLKDMKQYAKEYAESFYEYYPAYMPIDNDNIGTVYETDRLCFIYFSNEWNNNGSRAFNTHYCLIEPEYTLEIRCVYFTDDVDFISKTEHRMDYIVNSVFKHK